MLKKSKYLYIIGLVVVFFIAGGILSLKLVVAQSAGAIFKFDSATTNLPPDAQVTVSVDTGTVQIGFVKAVVVFDPNKIQLVQMPSLIWTDTNIVEETTLSQANQSGRWTVALGLQPGKTAPAGMVGIAQMQFHAISTADNDTASVVVDTTQSQVVNMNETAVEITSDTLTLGLNPAATPTPTPTITPTPAPINDNQAYLEWPGTNLNLADKNEFNLPLKLRTNGSVSGVDAVITFDPAKVTATKIDHGQLLNDLWKENIDNATGVIKFSQTAKPGEGFTGEGILATIYFQPVTSGQSQIIINYVQGATTDSNVIDLLTGRDILQPTLPEILDIQIKPQLEVQVQGQGYAGAINGTVAKTDNSWSQDFLTNDSGTSPVMDLAATDVGNLVSFYVSAKGYLRKKSTLDVAGGVNKLDAGTLLSGDINGDGIVNNVDLSLLYDAWFETGNGGWITADYNHDGMINSADHWLVTSNFLAENE